MPTHSRFEQKHVTAIVSKLVCHDRVIFKGYLPFGGTDQLNGWIDYGLKVLRKDFLSWAEKLSQELVDHAQQLAQEHQAPYQFLQGSHRKEELVQKILKERPITSGLVVVFCCMETCRAVTMTKGRHAPVITWKQRPQRVLYFYFLDPDFGLRYVRLQTWFPFDVQVYLNGHDWLACQLQKKRIGFEQIDNALLQIDNVKAAQSLADRFPQLDWCKVLSGWVKAILPRTSVKGLQPHEYYWCLQQVELSADLEFRDAAALTKLYPQLLDHATFQFSASDVMQFLGRSLHHRFQGRVQTNSPRRWPGARVKHQMKGNWLKMYNKGPRLLRIEMVINQPTEFKVRRSVQRQGRRCQAWVAMRKGVSNFPDFTRHAQSAIQRYLDALAVVDIPVDASALQRACEPRQHRQRRQRGLQPLRASEQQLFRAVMHGEHRIKGFRHRDLQCLLHTGKAATPQQQRQRRYQLGRQLQLLRAHQLIAKVPRTHRYRITKQGETIMTQSLALLRPNRSNSFSSAA